MKWLLISTAFAADFYLRNNLRSRSNTDPTFTLHGSTIFAARHVAQSNSAVGATGGLRRTEYIPTRDTEAGTFAGLWTAQTEWRRRARRVTSVSPGRPPGAAFAGVPGVPRLIRMLARVSANPRLSLPEGQYLTEASITNSFTKP